MHTKFFSVTTLLLMSAMTASAQQPQEEVCWPSIDIFPVITRLADEMDKEFIIDPRIPRQLQWSTAADNADYDTLLAVLRANFYAAIEVGDQIRIVSEQTARSEPSRILNDDDSRVSDHAIVTRVIDVADIEYTLPDGTSASSAPQLVPVLRPMMSTNIANITSIPGSTKLIIVDRYDNVRRITAIVDELRQ
jgi:type II secretory pathway component GspD/PulD (secretin)